MAIDLSVPCRYPRQKPDRNGYVRVGRSKPGRERLAHRRAYEEAYGPVPSGWTVDHECHNADATCPGGVCAHRACVEPLHLEAKPRGANTLASLSTVAAINLAKTSCDSGHEFTDGNTYVDQRGRQCRMCKLIWRQEQVRRQRAQQWGVTL